jgi:1-deoxy-D-xylulose-5-phosphate synthase
MFEEFGFNYIGPIDGHDLDSLIPTLENIKKLKGPQFLHVVTKKGQGYKLAEAEPILYHGTGKFNPLEGIMPAGAPGKITYTEVFGNWLCDMAAVDARLVGITPAMREGSGMVRFHQQYPERYFDVGIAEQHAVTFGGGLATEGLKPVVAIYSTFLQRGYDQLIHDVALQNLDVTFALDRAGLVGADGATHAGNYDLPYLRCIPNMVVMAPSNENECRQMLTTAYHYPGPAAVRYPRGAGVGTPIAEELASIEIAPSLGAAADLNATVANMRFVKPLDVELVKRLAADHACFVTVEEGAVMGGAGSAVAEAMAAAGIVKPLLILGLPDQFIDHGDPAALLASVGLDAKGIAASIRARFGAAGEPRLVVNNT